MSKDIEFKRVISDNEILYSKKEMRINGKTITTPIKSLDLSKIDSKIQINPKVKGLNEIHRKLTQETIYNILHSPDKQRHFNYQLSYLMKKPNVDEEITISFLEYEDEKYPESKSLEFILDTAYQYSDITPLPIISNIEKRIKDEKSFLDYKNFLEKSISIINTLNNKPIIGIIPPIGYVFVSDLIDFYDKKEINAFVFDFDGKTPIALTQTIRIFMRELKNKNLLNNCFIHAININHGRFNKDVDVIGAKDILSYSLGFDGFGIRYKPLKAPKEFFEKLKNYEEKQLRLFNKDDYGYYKLNAENINDIYPLDTLIDIEMFSNKGFDVKKVQKNFNAEQQGMEAFRLRNIIEQSRSKEYLLFKQQIKEDDLKKIMKMKKEVETQKKL